MTQDRATSLKNVLAGGGEMGTLMRRFDWESTCLGAVENWSHSLRTAVSILLNSPYPAFIAWGSRFIQLYNDRYIRVLLNQHPQALGRPLAEVSPELWSAIGSILQNVRDTGEPTVSAQIPLFANCNGFRQQMNLSFSCNPIWDESGRVGGVFVTCTETSQGAIANTCTYDNECNPAKPAYLSISETITDAFVACDRNWRYTYISKEAERLVGKTQQELLGKLLWEVFPDLQGSQYEQEFQRSLTDQVNVEFEVYYQPFKQWIAVRAYPSCEGISIYFQTITQRKRAEQRQQAQYAVTRVLAEATTLA
ncbi:MAG TPA: PAS domain-containing protein, partial [Coleofasciculaceae cyanobacterium]